MDADQTRKSTMPDSPGMPDEAATPGPSSMIGANDSTMSSPSGTVVGVFAEAASAERAVQKLRNAGFTEEQVGYAARHPGDEGANAQAVAGADTDADADDDAARDKIASHLAGEHHGGTREGLVMGGVTGLAFGSIVGAAAALLLPGIGPVIAGGILGAALIGGAAGTVTGGLAGALRDWGFSHEDVEYYHHEFEAGRTIVSVHAGSRGAEAVNILQNNGALKVSATGGATRIGGTNDSGTTALRAAH